MTPETTIFLVFFCPGSKREEDRQRQGGTKFPFFTSQDSELPPSQPPQNAGKHRVKNSEPPFRGIAPRRGKMQEHQEGQEKHKIHRKQSGKKKEAKRKKKEVTQEKHSSENQNKKTKKKKGRKRRRRGRRRRRRRRSEQGRRIRRSR